MKILLPLITQWSPSRRARVARAAMSEPVPGSVMASAQTASPRAMGGSHRRFWASVPKRTSQGDDMSVCTMTLKAKPPERPRASSSARTTDMAKSPSAPPYATGNWTPRKPSSPIRRNTARGM
jgi:hypothetical protein